MEISEETHDRYKDEYDKSYSSADYSIKRLDIILVSVSLAGIVFNFEFLKWFLKEHPTSNYAFPIISIMFFGLCLVTNILSQFFSYKAHYTDYIYYRNQLNNIAELDMPEGKVLAEKSEKLITRAIEISSGLEIVFILLAITLTFIEFLIL